MLKILGVQVFYNYLGNSIWLKAVKDKGYLLDWNSCPQDIKESVRLNIGYSAGHIPDQASFSKILIYLNFVEPKKLEGFFKWMRQRF